MDYFERVAFFAEAYVDVASGSGVYFGPLKPRKSSVGQLVDKERMVALIQTFVDAGSLCWAANKSVLIYLGLQ